MKSNYEVLMDYALKLISKKRYTQKELEKKLSSRLKDSGGDVKKVIARLLEFKYINDDEFAHDFVEDRIRFSPRGKRLIRLELRRKGINKETAKKAVEDCKINEFDLAMSLLKRKQSVLKKLEGQKKKEKIFMILASKGFDFDTIYKAADKC